MKRNLCNGLEITFILEKYVVEDDVLFTNHQAGCDWLRPVLASLLHMTNEQCGMAWCVTSDSELWQCRCALG